MTASGYITAPNSNPIPQPKTQIKLYFPLIFNDGSDRICILIHFLTDLM
jgi:hypothetical protein